MSREHVDQRLRELVGEVKRPVVLRECPDPPGRCRCRPTCVCGWPKHMAIHGGVIGQPGRVFGHYFQQATFKDVKQPHHQGTENHKEKS